MADATTVIVSGIVPGFSGVGRVMSSLVEDATDFPEGEVRFIFGGSGIASVAKRAFRQGRVARCLQSVWHLGISQVYLSTALRRHNVVDASSVVLVHPQTIGFRRCIELIEARSRPTYLYLMDNSFFCVRSYNYIPGERSACLRCLGGNWSQSSANNCKPFPRSDPDAWEFQRRLMKYADSHRVLILAQNRMQATLARKHFGDRAIIQVVGLWAKEWDFLRRLDRSDNQTGRYDNWDVVFHNSAEPAKGAMWAIELAQHCPELKFLFPFSDRVLASSDVIPPANCTFSSLTWETGLRDAVESSRFVLVPSLWSAPIEGALVKSIALGNAVAVVDEPTAFSSELSDDLVLKLPADPCAASNTLTAAIEHGWTPDAEEKSAWIRSFVEANELLLSRFRRCTLDYSKAHKLIP